MTEAEWLTCTDPRAMLAFWRPHIKGWKLRRFGVAACRLLTDRFITDVPGQLLALAEQLAEKDGDRELHRTKLAGQVREVFRECVERFGPRTWLMDVVEEVLMNHAEAVNLAAVLVSWLTEGQAFQETFALIRYLNTCLTEADATQAQLIRCIFGNPFRPVAFDPVWRSETTVSLASGIYAERAFDRPPILADALEEAGCDHTDMLSHCRGPGPHVRGCWVVDLVLGKA